MTKAVNLYHDKYDVYIGRRGRHQDGYFGNPFPVLNKDSTHLESIAKFKVYFYDRLKNDQEFRNRVLELKDKTLGCFCKPNNCHGDVIVEWLDGTKRDEGNWD